MILVVTVIGTLEARTEYGKSTVKVLWSAQCGLNNSAILLSILVL